MCVMLGIMPLSRTAASGLKVALLDESGQPAAHEVAGKVTLSWRSGSKKVTWGAQAATATPGIKLPPAKVRVGVDCRSFFYLFSQCPCWWQ